MFNGVIANLKYHYFNGASFDIHTKTGELKIIKVDEWGDSAKSGIQFKLWHAAKNGDKYVKSRPFVSETDWHLGIEQSVFETDENGEIYISGLASDGYFDDGQAIGTYIVQEVASTNPYILNSEEYVVKIDEGTRSELVVANENRVVEFEIFKSDLDAVKGEEMTYINEATFQIFDISHHYDLSIDTNEGKNPLLNNYFLRVGKTVDLDLLFKDDQQLNEVSNKHYAIATQHCDSATLVDRNLTANKSDVLRINIFVENEYLTSRNVYLIHENEFSDNDYFILSGTAIWQATTGHNYYQVVDEQKHHLPIKDYEFKVYYEKELNEHYGTFVSDGFGMIDFAKMSEVGKGVDDEDGIYYYLDQSGELKTLSQNEIDGGKKINGRAKARNLKHSRKYLVCEFKLPDNYDIPDGQNPCFLLDTADYQKDEQSHEVIFDNKRGRGDFELIKLDEWLNRLGDGVKFKIHHAALIDNGLPYFENYLNVLFDENGLPVKGEVVKNPLNGEDYFIVDENSEINIYNELYFGYYILEECESNNPLLLNKKAQLIYIEHGKNNTIDFIDENREVSVELSKYDAEENHRLINDAEFTIYDISEKLDFDNVPTKLGVNGDEIDIDEAFLQNAYEAKTLYFVKIGQEVNLYDLLIADKAELVKTVANRPLTYSFKEKQNAVVTADGFINGLKSGYKDIEVFGDSIDLYGTAGPLKVYQDEAFDPYGELHFYRDASGKKEMRIASIEYTGEIDTSKIGTYILHYTLVTKDRIKYEFDRSIDVIEDKRHYCKHDLQKDEWYYPDTLKPCDPIDEDFLIEQQETKIVPLVIASENFDDWQEKPLLKARVYLLANDLISDDESHAFKIPGIELTKAMTGHNYIQTIDTKNHNLPLANQELITYYDEKLQYPYKRYISDDLGMIDLNDDRATVLAPPPYINTDEGGFYIPKAVEILKYQCPDSYRYDEEIKYCVCDNQKPTPAILEKKWDIKKEYLHNFKPIDEDMMVQKEINEIYYQIGIKNDEPIIKKASLSKNDGHLVFPNLKHSRKYLLCETKVADGYDYVANQNPCQLIDTSKLAIGIENVAVNIANLLRQVDVIVYKTNSDKSILLNGAVFDVYDVFEDGVDQNVIKDKYRLAYTADGSIYYKDDFYATDNHGACQIDGKMSEDYIGVDKDGNLTNISNPEGLCYRRYYPNYKQKIYLGRYISGGIYGSFNDFEGSKTVEISSDKDFTNIIKRVELDKDGYYTVLGLNDGIYYCRLQGNHSDINRHTIKQGAIILPKIKYGHNLLVKEIKVPIGYYFDESDFYIYPEAEYGSCEMENYRINNAIIIPATGR